MAGIDSFTKLMLHMNSDFSDSSDSGHTPTVSGATIDTTIKKFGAGSGKFVSASSQSVLYPDSDDWFFDIDNFTLDLWARWSTVSNSALIVHVQDAANMWYIDYYNNTLRFANYLDGSFTVYWAVNWTPSVGTWYHIAMVRKGIIINDWNYYVGGVELTDGKILNGGSWGGIVSNFTNNLKIGRHLTVSPHNGHFDEIRISKGIARWTSNFTPPTSEYTSDIVTPDMWQPEIQQPYKERIEVINYN